MDTLTELVLLITDDRILRANNIMRSLDREYPAHHREVDMLWRYVERLRRLRGEVESSALPAGEAGPRLRDR